MPLVRYTDADLVVHRNAGNWSVSLCQETDASNTGSRAVRGSQGVSFFGFTGASTVHMNGGWRPVLELVP